MEGWIDLVVAVLPLVVTILKIWGANKRLVTTVEVIAEEVEKHKGKFPGTTGELTDAIRFRSEIMGTEDKLKPIVRKVKEKVAVDEAPF